MTGFATISDLEKYIPSCESCTRLRQYCQQVAARKKKAFRHQVYWGKPVPGWGDMDAWLLVVGLAPGAHGANRTGRMFTGDSSGSFLYSALFQAGLCSQPTATHLGDGLELNGVYITAVARCAPPDNKPEKSELQNCRGFLAEELRLLKNIKAILCLGKIAFDGVLGLLEERTGIHIKPKPAFAHGIDLPIGRYHLFASYHVSQRNTATGLLNVEMFARVLAELKLHR